jgi:hypothetical protein
VSRREGVLQPLRASLRAIAKLFGLLTVETRYFISSLEDNAEQFGNSIRSHWGSEGLKPSEIVGETVLVSQGR